MINFNNIQSMESFIHKSDSYIFIRFLSAKYKNTVALGSIVNKLLGIIDKADVPGEKAMFNHASINYNLKDTFYGLTGSYGTKHYLKIESINIINNNKNPFLQTTTPDSYFSVYAIPVTDKDNQKVKLYLESTLKENNINYGAYVFPLIGVQRLSNKIKGLESVSIAQDDLKKETLICSTFVEHVLHKCTSYGKIIDDSEYNYKMFTPNDIIKHSPGIIRLFGGRFDEYNKLLNEFIVKNPKFAKFK